MSIAEGAVPNEAPADEFCSPDGVDGERHWRSVPLGVDDKEFEPCTAVPESLEHFSESRANEAYLLLANLNNRISRLFHEVESAEWASRRSESRSPRMREVRQHLRRVLAGWESHVLVGFDRAEIAMRTEPVSRQTDDECVSPG